MMQPESKKGIGPFMDEGRIVWVLGAGFSAPLGAPTLQQLLGPSTLRDVQVRYPQTSFPELHGLEARVAHALYGYGTRFNLGGKEALPHCYSDGQQLWSDAEEYLDRLDAAADRDDPRMREHIDIIHGSLVFGAPQPDTRLTLRGVANAARRLVAAECSLFLENIETGSERFEPYIDWSLQLMSSDRIVTFNYDRVLERLAECQRPVEIIWPTVAESGTRTPAYKLHGSVDWRLADGGTGHARVAPKDSKFALTCTADEMLLATPGPTKLRTCKDALEDLWQRAEQALQLADAIVFVGYRFPPTDSNARKRLLRAISRNESRLGLNVFTILGPNSPDEERLVELLRHALLSAGWRQEGSRYSDVATPKSFALVPEPLYAQDFFSLVRRSDLFRIVLKQCSVR